MNGFQMEVLRQVVGHSSHNIGWDGIHASSLDLLTEVLQNYMTEIGRLLHIYSEQFGRTGANLDDLGLTFRDMGISIQDLSDYVSNVEPTCFHQDIAKLPIPREHTLNFLKPGSHEVLTRPVHIHEHLPPMQHITLGDEKNSEETQDDVENLNVTVAESTEIFPCSTLSPRAYPFKRPEGAEKRKGGWLDDEGQPIREISSVMMTTSGYLSSSREGKLPETKLRKTPIDPELDSFPTAEKKVNMKKVFEGIKKSEERNSDFGKKSNEIPRDRDVGFTEEKKLVRDGTKESQEAKKERSKEKIEHGRDRENEPNNVVENLSDRSYEIVRQHDKEKEKDLEKETEVEKVKEHEKEKEQDKAKFSDKEKERERDKLKKKRGKEKLLEEFAFFEKEKVVCLKTPEQVPSMDSTKQKLNIFKKRTSKTRDQDNQTPRISLHTGIASENTDMSDKNVVESLPGGSSKSQTEKASPLKTEFFGYEKPKTTKKERKLKNKKDRYDYSPETIQTIGDHHKRKPGKDFLKGDPQLFKSESLDSVESSSFGKVNQNKFNNPTTNDEEPLKKKRGRPRALTPEHTEACHSSEFVSSTHVESVVPSIPKPFIPFPSHFPVPGLIPPPFIPLNLLGIPPMGLRSPLGIPPTTSTSSNATNMTLSPGTHLMPPKGDPSNRVQSMVSPTSKSPNIVDSLTEATEMSLDVLSCEEDSNVNKKKDKRDKKEKEKRKKEKKLKGKLSDESERKAKREKKKEKKDKEKEKEKPEKKEKEENITVPKITFKFAAAPTSPPPSAIETTPKLIFKAISDREGNFTTSTSGQREQLEPFSHPPGQAAVEVAKFSALVTRPPKLVKSVKKEILPSEEMLESPCNSQLSSGVVPRTPSPSSKIRREKPQKPPRVTKDKEKEKEKEKKKTDKPGDVAVITETVGSYYDEFGNKIWICPACGRQDDGTPMIGCDECDDWYHWVCVGIRVPPAETESWFCQRCIAKKQGSLKEKKKAKKKKPV